MVWKTIFTRGMRDQSKDRDLVEPVEDVVARGVEVLRVSDDLAVVGLSEDRDEAAVVERPHDLLVDVRHELARRVDRREAQRRRLGAHRRRDAVRREDDAPVVGLRGFEIVHRGKAEPGHLALDAFVVHDLPEDRARLALRGGEADELVRDAHAGAETVLLGEDDLHQSPFPSKSTRTRLLRERLHEPVALDQLEALAAARDGGVAGA